MPPHALLRLKNGKFTVLKKLIIQGFKSFPDKIILDFPSGITAIVGPNGSGKSNIVDAIRWVLGEQSLKNIRLGKSEDVIFAGTPQRPASGFASVELLFDNSRRLFPEEREEIAVGRKLYRDGASAYILNGEEVRLKDIVRLMAAGKLGTKGLAIITQGSGDAFLAASPSERREMLEEAVGLKEYRLKKEEAERKMEETKMNLEKVDALLLEITPHLRSLKRQVSKWERRQEKAEELRSLEEKYFHWRLRRIEEGADVAFEREALEREIESLRQNLKELENRRAKTEDLLAALRAASSSERLLVIEREREEMLRALGHIEGKIEAIRGMPSSNIPAPKELIKVLENIKKKLSAVLELKDWERARMVIKELLQEIEAVFSSGSAQSSDAGLQLEKEKTDLLSRLESLDAEIARIRQESEASRLEHEKALSELETTLRELDAKRQLLSEKQEVLQEYRLESEKRRLQEEDLAARLREAGWDYEEFRKAHLGLPSPEIESPAEIEAKILRLRRELADIGSIDEELVREYNETKERYDFLEAQKSDLSGALEDLESLKKELNKKIDREFRAAIQRINAELQHYFRLIFGGGSARLKEERPRLKKLEPSSEGEVIGEEDKLALQELPEPLIEEGGIEIDVDLPRKKVKSLDMLSGGERALTAIALVFAVAGASGPPFMMLDEVDAPLDETNSQRFGQLLRSLAGRTQFILVTHNRVTMEAADVLYGVTMQDGISKIFSLKFQEAQELASKDVHAAA
jgi:chromosome segregation ATPase